MQVLEDYKCSIAEYQHQRLSKNLLENANVVSIKYFGILGSYQEIFLS